MSNNNNSTLPIIAVGALGLSSISCVISSLTGFLLSDDSNVESNTSTDTSNTNTDTSNTSTETSNTSTDTSNTSTETDYTIPHQISLGTDGWCREYSAVHQDVPGCGRICSTAINVGSKRDGTWGPWADNSTVASTCVGAKLDEIWELQDDGTRKLADGYTLSDNPNTGFQTNGEGKVYYLDRHHVNCNNDGLRRFQLKNDYTDDTNYTMAYEFGCLTGLGITETTEKETTPDVDGDPPHTVYLDRHTVDCGTKPITQFKLHRNSEGDKIHYKYQCGDTTSNSCRDVTTEYNDQGAGNVIYLDRHDVKCNEGEYLSKFRLDAGDNDKYRYEYKCCTP